MPHASLKLVPGVDVNKTPALNEMAISDCQFIRFVPDRNGLGLVQKLGGWQRFINYNFGSTIKSIHAWQDNLLNKRMAAGMIGLGPYNIVSVVGNGTYVRVQYTGPQIFEIGQEIELIGVNPTVYNGHHSVLARGSISGSVKYIDYTSTTTTAYVSGGIITGAGNSLNVSTNQLTPIDITPQTYTDNAAVKLTTTAGSNLVLVTITGSNVDQYDSVYFETDISVGGIVIRGLYPCVTVSAGVFGIEAIDPLGNPMPATFSTLTAPINVTGASGTGSVATLTYTNAYEFTDGDSVTVASVNPSGYNGTYIVTASTTGGSVSYASTTSATYVSGGTINNQGVVSKFVTTNGSSLISVILPFHGYVAGNTVAFLVSTTVAGVTIYGEYIVQEIVSDSEFKINAANAATSATSAYINNGLGRFKFYVGYGSLEESTGYGIGGYGEGGYGTGVEPTGQAEGVPINAEDWSLDNWGEILLANPRGDGIYEWIPSDNALVATIIPQGPAVNEGMFVAMPQRQIIAYGSSFTGIQDPLLIRWCDVNNYSVWQATTVNQAGSYRIPKGSKIVGGLQGPQQGLIWTDLSLWAMQYIGGQFIYSFTEISTGCGLIGQKAMGVLNNATYWMSQSQFFTLGAGGVMPVMCPVWDVIFQDIDMDNVDKIRCAPNSRFGEISWYYPTVGSNGIPTKYVKYNAALQQWDFGTLTRTAWINQSVYANPIGAGGDNYLYEHEVGTNNGTAPMTSYFQTGYFAMSEADVKMFVDQVWPDMKWGFYNQAQNAVVKLSFYVNDYAGQTPTVYGPYTMSQLTTYITPRFRGRLVSIRIESTSADMFWRIGNMRYRFQPDGRF